MSKFHFNELFTSGYFKTSQARERDEGLKMNVKYTIYHYLKVTTFLNYTKQNLVTNTLLRTVQQGDVISVLVCV